MAKLTAAPATVIIDVENGPPDGITRVSYEKDKEHLLWQRLNFDAWSLRAISSAGPDDVANKRGTLDSLRLRPGDFYEMVVVHPDDDPNQTLERMQARVSVPALRKRPEERDLISDEANSEGGTWCDHNVATNRPVICQMQVAASGPQTGAFRVHELRTRC
jgi:hypothetical protein